MLHKSNKHIIVKEHGYSLWTATVFIIGELCGGGIMSLAYSASQAGWASIGFIVYCAFCAATSGICLAKCWLILEERYPEYRLGLTRKPFAAIGFHSFGKCMSVLLSVLIIITRIGSGTVYLLLASNLIESLLSEYVTLSLCEWIPIVSAVIMIPLWLGSPADFWPIAYTAMCSSLVGAIILLAGMAMELRTNGISDDFHVDSFQSFASSFGIIIFAFGGAVAFPNFQNDMRRKDKFPKAVALGFIGLILIYLPIVILGYLNYGYHTASSILENLPNGVIIKIVKICFVIDCASVIFIVINPVFLDLEELFNIPKEFNWKRCLLRSCILVFAAFIGETFPTFGKILDLIGGSTIALMSFALPPVFYVKLVLDQKLNLAWPQRQIPLYLLIVFGLVVATTVIGGVVSTYSTISEWTALQSACYITKSASTNTTLLKDL